MHSYEYIPEIHRITPLSLVDFFRREMKLLSLVIYHHQVFKTWVLSLKEEDRLFDVGLLGDGNGEGPWVSREQSLKLIHTMKNLITKLEAKKRLKAWYQQDQKNHADECDQQLTGHRKVYRRLKKRWGEHAAEKYAHETGFTTLSK